MATITDLAGTTLNTFTIGDEGITVFWGKIEPTLNMGKVGDIYVQTIKSLVEDDEVPTFADLQNIDTDAVKKNYVVRVTADEMHSGRETVYQWDGAAWIFLFYGDEEVDIKESFGRVYYKCIKDGDETWEFIKNYSFDNEVIHANETGDGSNNFFISIESAKNTNIVASTKANDYEKNHSQYGVTRFAANSEITLNGSVDKNIAATPKQIRDLIEAVFNDKMIDVVNSSSTDTKIPTAKAVYTVVHNEEIRAEGAEADLQEQIDAIESRRDIADIVSNYATPSQPGYTTLKAYPNLDKLSARDIIKVIIDEHNDDRETYYEWVNYIVETQSDLPTSATSGEEARVKSTNKYYRYNGSSWVEIDITTSEGTLVLWNQVGYVDAYTREQTDATFMHKNIATGDGANETILGNKTFSNNLVIGNTTVNTTINSDGSIDLKPTTSTGSQINFHFGGATNETAQIKETVSGVLSLKSIGDASDSTTSLSIPTMGWVNDPTKATNVVHKSGNETINGTKTFTSTTIGTTQSIQPGASGYNNKILTTGEWVQTYVTTRIGSSYNLPNISADKKGQVLSINSSGNGYVWKEVRDLTKLKELDDVNTAGAVTGDTLVYDASTDTWNKGRQVTATISYW